MNARHFHFFFVAVLSLSLTSCERSEPTPRLPGSNTASAPDRPDVVDAPEPTTSPKTPPSLGEGIIARGRGVEVRVDDFADHTRRAMLFAPDDALATRKQPDPRILRTPYVHMNVTRALVAAALAEDEASQRGITLDEPAIEAALAADELLRRFKDDGIVGADGQALGVTLADLGLTRADVLHAGRQIALRKALVPRLLDEITVEDTWRHWSNAHDVVDMVVVSVPNVPTTDELDAFVSSSQNEPRIREYFEANIGRFRDPKTVLLDTLTGKPGETPDDATLEQARIALESNEPLDRVAERLGLVYTSGNVFIAAEDRAAYSAKDGQVGISKDAPRGSYAWRVIRHVDPPAPTLDRSRKREVAAEILRTQERSPAAQLTVDRAHAILSQKVKSPEALVATLEKELADVRGIRIVRTGSFTPTPNQFVPKLGVNRALHDFAFAAKRGDTSASNPSLRGDQTLLVVRVLARARPDRAAFDAGAAQNLSDYRRALEPRIVDVRLSEWFDSHEVQLDMRPLRERYGIEAKPGTRAQ